MDEIRLALVILAVEDLPRARSFYVAAFGWRCEVDTPAYCEFALPLGLRLGLYARGGFAHNVGSSPARIPPGSIAPTELYLYPADLEAAIRRVEAAGARVLSPRAERDWGDEAMYFADPDGNVVVLARRLASSE